MRTIQDILTGHRKNDEFPQAAALLRSLLAGKKHNKRTYPDPNTKQKSGDWNLVREYASKAFTTGNYDAFPALAMLIRDAFHARDEEGRSPEIGRWADPTADLIFDIETSNDEGREKPEQRQQRAIETLEACLDAVVSYGMGDKLNFFRWVNIAMTYAIKVIEKERRWPTKGEVIIHVEKKSRDTIDKLGEAPKIRKAAYLDFLPKSPPDKSDAKNQKTSGFKTRRK